MSRKKKSKGITDAIEASLLPVMNIMFLLIPALLMAMEFAQMSSITVQPPRTTASVADPTEKPQEELDLEVVVARDGITVTAAGKPVGERIRRDDGGEGYDFAALTAAIRPLKELFPDESRVILRAENDIQLQTVVATLDVLRGGETCSLAQGPSDGCLFWQPVIRDI